MGTNWYEVQERQLIPALPVYVPPGACAHELSVRHEK